MAKISASAPLVRSYKPGRVPETVFTSQNGASSFIQFGGAFVNAELSLTFANISDQDAADILQHYSSVVGDDRVTFGDNKGFGGMEGHPERWDWNSNDADVCCAGSAEAAWLIWGAGTQGRQPLPPLTHAHHATNVVGRARGKRFIALSGQERIVYDQNLDYVEEESMRHKRKGETDND